MGNSQRDRRRELLTPHQSIIRSIKQQHLVITSHCLEDTELLSQALTQHISKIIQPAYHETIAATTLLNEQELISQLSEKPRPEILECHVRVTTLSQKTEQIGIDLRYEIRDNSRHQGYFEAIIQLRHLTSLQNEAVQQALDSSAIRIAKRVKHPAGEDLYITDSHRGHSQLQGVKRKYGGTLVRSQRAAGVDQLTSKKRYRVTILYKGNE